MNGYAKEMSIKVKNIVDYLMYILFYLNLLLPIGKWFLVKLSLF